jgi:2',3'-cyclic-nucleotide 2'-phosphodiesterase (5'-nucleotidase family)
MGGLARRVSYIKAFRTRSSAEVPTLFVDAGNLFTDDRFSAGQLPGEASVKNKWVVRGYGEFHHDAANISYSDLPYLGELLKKEGYDQRVEELPFVKRLISANVVPVGDTFLSPPPYVIREITLKRGSAGKKVRVGIVGFTESKPVGPNQKESVYGSFRIDDAFEAAKRVLPELKQKADFIVALAYMPQEQAQRLASENPEIDTIIGARQISSMDEPLHFSRATISYAYKETKYLGEMRVYVKPDGSVENQTNRYIALDSFIPDDPNAVETVTTAHTEFTNEQNKGAQTATPAIRPTSFLGGSQSQFVGTEGCATCHAAEHAKWQTTGHAKAMATLEKASQQFDTQCVGCHSVGFQKGGFQSVVTTPQYANVQCESCHGPGRQHADSPAKGYGFMPTPVGCVQCHTPKDSPRFNFGTYWAKIAHGAGS